MSCCARGKSASSSLRRDRERKPCGRRNLEKMEAARTGDSEILLGVATSPLVAVANGAAESVDRRLDGLPMCDPTGCPDFQRTPIERPSVLRGSIESERLSDLGRSVRRLYNIRAPPQRTAVSGGRPPHGGRFRPQATHAVAARTRPQGRDPCPVPASLMTWQVSSQVSRNPQTKNQPSEESSHRRAS